MSNSYKVNKSILIGITILLVAVLVASSYYLIDNWLKQKNQEDKFEELEKIIIRENIDDKNEEQNLTNNEENENNVICSSVDLSSLKSKNTDLVGWIRIDGTNINYPVMQNGQYYLRKNFYKEYSYLGTPFLAEQCDLRTSDCLIIYGHHIKSGAMFADLVNFKNYNYYKNHKYIKFYTMENGITIENNYEIIYAFKTTTNVGGFRYYSYNQFYDKTGYEEFIGNCQSMQLYNTGVNTSYGDKFIMLSTCEYSQDNGRMVVVGVKR